MTAGQWEKLKPIFERALELAAAERNAYLDTACASDAALRALLGDLLASHDQAKSFLADPSGAVSHRVFPDNLLVAGRFRIARFLGRGGMGEVYEAQDERLRLRVALKTIRPELSRDPDSVARFEREIRIAREVTHENLCRVYDLAEHAGESGALTCFTMEFLEGESLQERLNRGPLSLAEALPLIGQVARGLEALHRAGIVHRDLKPGNVMLVPGEHGLRAVVTDFGLAKPVRDDRDPFESHLDVQAGAPYFMAPELFRGGKPTRESDIFSFGLVIDQMITASRAFPAPPQRAGCAPIAPRDRCPDLPAHWNAAILRCLEADPARRYSSPEEAFHELERVPRAERSRAWGRRLRLVAVAAGAGAAVLAAVSLIGPPPAVRDNALVVFDIGEIGEQPTRLGRAFVSEIVTRLTKLDQLRVVRYYEPRDKAALANIDERLHLDGDLQGFHGQVRLTLRLTDARERRILWSKQFEGQASNPLEMQTRIAGAVSGELEGKLLRDAVKTAGVHYAAYPLLRPLWQWFTPGPNLAQAALDPAAYDYYVRGRQLWDERTVPSLLAAIESYQRAIDRDPRFALAHAAMADAYMALIEVRYASQDELVRHARQFASRAVELDPASADAQLSLAGVHQLDWDWPAAEARYREAIRINPKHWRAHRAYGSLIVQFGRFDEALAEVGKGVELDPYDYPAQSAHALYLFMAGRHAEALGRLRATLARKDLLYAQNVLGSVYARHGQLAAGAQRDEYFRLALGQAARVEAHERRSSQATPMSDQMYATYYALMGRPAEAKAYVARLRDAYLGGKGSATGMALVYGLLGEREEALRLLQTALAARERWLFHLKVHPFWSPLRDAKEFQQAVQAMRL